MQKQNERLRLISEALASLIDATDPAAVVRELLPRAARHLEADAYFNYMVDASGGVLRMHASGGIEPEIAKSIERLEFGQAICGTVAQTGRPIHATDIQNSIDEKSALVRGFGIQARQVRSKKEFPAALAEMLNSKSPYLLDVITPYQEHVLPMIPSGMTVKDIIVE